eukprot:s432_g3.t1
MVLRFGSEQVSDEYATQADVDAVCRRCEQLLKSAQLASDFLPVLALVGSPVGLVSGRSTALCNSLVDRLSQELGYAVLRPSEVVGECIALSEKPPQEPDWPILARMRELGKEASQGSGVSPGVQAEMLFRKIELLSAPAPKPVEEEDPKKKPKGKDKKEEVPEPVRPKGILVLGYPAELRQLASWEAALRGFTSSLLQLMDSEESQQARLGSLLAPFWVEGESATPVVKAEERELAKAAEKADFDPEFAPPVRIVRLRYPDEATLLEAVQKEDMSAEGRANEGESRLCHGLEEEMATMQCAADQAWLFESAQVFATKLSAPLHNVHDVLVQDGEEGDDVIPAAEAILKRIRELVAFWHRPILEVGTADAKPDAVEAPEKAAEAAEAVEAEGVAPPEGPEENETAEPAASDGDKEAGQPTEGKDEAEDLEQEAVNTLLIKDSRQTKEAFQNLWLQNMSHYLLGIRETLLEVDDHASSYCKDLIFMQRRFLEFLQRPDDKAQVLEEFLRGFPVRNNVPPGSRQADELSEQLQDLADRLWVHANLRKQEAVEERYHQMTGGFWEEKAAAQLRLAHKLQAREIAEAALAQRDARQGAAQQGAAAGSEMAERAERAESMTALQGSAAAISLHLEDAAQLRGGNGFFSSPVLDSDSDDSDDRTSANGALVFWQKWGWPRAGQGRRLATVTRLTLSCAGGKAVQVDHEKVRKMREEFEGATAEYKVLSQGKSLQQRFKELEQAWGAFQWNQKSRSDAPSTREQVQAASAALAQAHGRSSGTETGLDLEQEVETVLAELWDTIEKPPKQRDQAEEEVNPIAEELDRLEAFIEARIQQDDGEERAEQEGRREKSRPNMEICEAQTEALQDMSVKFQSAYPSGMDEGTGGTPMTSNALPEESPVLPAAVHFGSEVRTLAREVQSVSAKLHQEHPRGGPPRGHASSNWIGDLAGGSGPALHERDGAWGSVFIPARSPALELARFKVAAAVLRWTYCQVDQDLNCFDISAVEPPPADLSSLQDLATWLDESAERFGSAEPSGVEEEATQAENELPQADSLPEEDSSLLEASASQIVEASSETSELVAALKAERHGLVSRCRCIAAWTYARLETMQQQHEEVFARMDDWIKDRVKEENEAIKATDTLLRSGRWEDEEPVFMTTRSMRRSQTATMKPALTGAAGKRRRDVLKIIIAKTLDVDVYIPQKLEVSEAAVPVPTRPSTSNSQAVGSRPSTTKPLRPVFPERWSQDMLWGLLTRLADLSGAVCSAEQLLQALLERRHCALGFNNEQVIPESWVMRPLVVYKLLCDSMVEPAWGASGVDVTEFLLVLSHHENSVPWPTPEALEETRAFLQSEESPLDQDVLASYPDVPISEELFCQLPLWPETCQPELRRWIFQVLATFADQEQVRLPAKPSRRPEDPSEFTITARRIFGYFALGHSPAESFSRLCRLLLPREALAAEEEPAQVLVKDLWTLLHSQRSRPSGLIAPVPDLAIFCNNLLEEAKAETAAAAAPKGKAAPKPKGKAKQEVEEEVEPPPLPEEATVAFSEKVLLQRKTVLRAFCSHGGLLCRRRGLEVLFPTAGSGWSLATSSQAAALQELQSLVPEATPEEEEAPA